ncbi:hypothetical protein SF83666_a43450 (plasmid) [Sinorhizobium fredii CCBAU 83666]|nr:hypothetical protein SF83666_a43450 [Sinorhizobium fredii CCBAU 83666]
MAAGELSRPICGIGILDLVELATIAIGANRHGEIAFGAMQAG